MPRPAAEITFQHLRYLVAVVDHRHFGRAADACHVSQPTLSAQLGRLEEMLGAPLIERDASPLAATPLGARVAREARGLLAGRAEIAALARQEVDELRGRLRLGAIPTVAPYLVPPLAATVQNDWRHADLAVVETPTADLTDRLRRGELDAALVATDERDPAWSHRTLGSEPFVAYLAGDHPLLERERLATADLPRGELWLLSDGHCFRDQVLAACGAEATADGAQVRFESGALDTLRRMVDTVGGLTLLPRMALASLPPSAHARVRRFADPVPSRTVRLLVRRSYGKRRLVEAAADHIQEALREHERPPGRTIVRW